MPTMESVTNNIHFSLFKGEFGRRKSTQALTYPKPQYWFDFDGKMDALQLPMRHWGIKPTDINFDYYNNWTKARIKMEAFQVSCPFKTLIVDTITTSSDAMLRQVRQAKKGTKRKSGALAGISIGDIDVQELEDFNAEAAGLVEMVALLKDIHKYHKIDIILIAHVIRTESKSLDNTITISRQIVTAAKKPAVKIPGACGEVYHFDTETDIDISKGGKFNIKTSNTGEDFARTALPLPNVIDIGNDSLYEKYVLPAIKKLNAEPEKVDSF